MIAGKHGRTPGYLQMAPGLDLLVTVGRGPIRGLKVMGGYLYVVSGPEVYQVSSMLQTILIGRISTSTGPVSMIQNGTQLDIFDGYAGWLTTANLAQGGGSPLTGGTIDAGGLDYAIGEEITLAQTGGTQDATAIVMVTAASGQALSGGTIGVGGGGYVIGQTITLAPVGGAQLQAAILVVSKVAAGAVTAFSIQQAGAFSAAPSSFTQASSSGAGAGFTLTAPSYAANVGIVTGFRVVQGGAFSAEPAQFTQASTTGSGSGIVITDPTFGTAAGLFQLDLPFSGGPVSATYQDGFGLVNDSLSNLWYQSDLFDLSVWEPLNFAEANSQPDNVKALVDLNREVFIIKDDHTEVWFNAGVAGFTFQRLEGVYIEYGTNAPFSVALAGQSFCLLTQNDQGGYEIRRVEGYNQRRISTHAVEAAIAKFPTVADAEAYSYLQEGHLFYVIGFPSGGPTGTTFVCDLTDSEAAGEPLWHKRASIENPLTGLIDGNFHRHWGNCYATWPAQPAQYAIKGITMVRGQQIQTAAELESQPTTFATALFSGWVYLPDGEDLEGFSFGNGGVQISVSNDASSSAGQQIGVTLLDASWALIVSATYAWTAWTKWVWIGISMDTATQTLQVFVGDAQLTPASISWNSSNPINNNAGAPWSLAPFDEAG